MELRDLRLGNRLQTTILLSLSLVWIIALFLVYLPISGLVTPTFPLATNYQYAIVFFIISTGLVSAAFFIKGFNLLKKPS
jgi:hypothetical protein